VVVAVELMQQELLLVDLLLVAQVVQEHQIQLQEVQ
jgi:hypothetical protein|tara:strand:- start:47 stop:154 length:108 start_codon:yes stop_codon:yes gene_type:complete